MKQTAFTPLTVIDGIALPQDMEKWLADNRDAFRQIRIALQQSERDRQVRDRHKTVLPYMQADVDYYDQVQANYQKHLDYQADVAKYNQEEAKYKDNLISFIKQYSDQTDFSHLQTLGVNDLKILAEAAQASIVERNDYSDTWYYKLMKPLLMPREGATQLERHIAVFNQAVMDVPVGILSASENVLDGLLSLVGRQTPKEPGVDVISDMIRGHAQIQGEMLQPPGGVEKYINYIVELMPVMMASKYTAGLANTNALLAGAPPQIGQAAARLAAFKTTAGIFTAQAHVPFYARAIQKTGDKLSLIDRVNVIANASVAGVTLAMTNALSSGVYTKLINTVGRNAAARAIGKQAQRLFLQHITAAGLNTGTLAARSMASSVMHHTIDALTNYRSFSWDEMVNDALEAGLIGAIAGFAFSMAHLPKVGYKTWKLNRIEKNINQWAKANYENIANYRQRNILTAKQDIARRILYAVKLAQDGAYAEADAITAKLSVNFSQILGIQKYKASEAKQIRQQEKRWIVYRPDKHFAELALYTAYLRDTLQMFMRTQAQPVPPSAAPEPGPLPPQGTAAGEPKPKLLPPPKPRTAPGTIPTTHVTAAMEAYKEAKGAMTSDEPVTADAISRWMVAETDLRTAVEKIKAKAGKQRLLDRADELRDIIQNKKDLVSGIRLPAEAIALPEAMDVAPPEIKPEPKPKPEIKPEPVDTITRPQQNKIHALKKELMLPDAKYKALVSKASNGQTETSAKLNKDQAGVLIDLLSDRKNRMPEPMPDQKAEPVETMPPTVEAKETAPAKITPVPPAPEPVKPVKKTGKGDRNVVPQEEYERLSKAIITPLPKAKTAPPNFSVTDNKYLAGRGFVAIKGETVEKTYNSFPQADISSLLVYIKEAVPFVEKARLVLPGVNVRDAGRRTAPAAPVLPARLVLTGVNVRYDGEFVIVMASDGARVYVRTFFADLGDAPFNMVIAKTTSEALAKLMGSEVSIAFDTSGVNKEKKIVSSAIIKHDGNYYTASTIPAVYPDAYKAYSVENITDDARRIEVSKAELLQAIADLLPLADTETNAVKLAVTGDNSLTLKIRKLHYGEYSRTLYANTTLPAKAELLNIQGNAGIQMPMRRGVDDQQGEVTLNIRLLASFAEAQKGETVKIYGLHGLMANSPVFYGLQDSKISKEFSAGRKSFVPLPDTHKGVDLSISLGSVYAKTQIALSRDIDGMTVAIRPLQTLAADKEIKYEIGVSNYRKLLDELRTQYIFNFGKTWSSDREMMDHLNEWLREERIISKAQFATAYRDANKDLTDEQVETTLTLYDTLFKTYAEQLKLPLADVYAKMTITTEHPADGSLVGKPISERRYQVSEQMALAKHEASNVRADLARNPSLAPAVQMVLAKDEASIVRADLARNPILSAEVKDALKMSYLSTIKKGDDYRAVNDLLNSNLGLTITDLKAVGTPAIIGYRARAKRLYDLLDERNVDSATYLEVKRWGVDGNLLKSMIDKIYGSDAANVMAGKILIDKEDIRARLNNQTDGFFTLPPMIRRSATQTITGHDYSISLFVDYSDLKVPMADVDALNKAMIMGQAASAHPAGYAFMLYNYVTPDNQGGYRVSETPTETVVITQTQSDYVQSLKSEQNRGVLISMGVKPETIDAVLAADKTRKDRWWDALVKSAIHRFLNSGVKHIMIFTPETIERFASLRSPRARELLYDLNPTKVGFSQKERNVKINGTDYAVRDLMPEAAGTLRFHDIRAYVDIKPDGTFTLGFLKPDITSGVHEMWHIGRAFLQDMAKHDPTWTALLKDAEDWAGVKGGIWTDKADEKFARAGEKYIYEGTAPNSKLLAVFRKIAEWVRALTDRLKQLAKIKLDDNIVRVYDALLGKKPEKNYLRKVQRDLAENTTPPKGKELPALHGALKPIIQVAGNQLELKTETNVITITQPNTNTTLVEVNYSRDGVTVNGAFYPDNAQAFKEVIRLLNENNKAKAVPAKQLHRALAGSDLRFQRALLSDDEAMRKATAKVIEAYNSIRKKMSVFKSVPDLHEGMVSTIGSMLRSGYGVGMPAPVEERVWRSFTPAQQKEWQDEVKKYREFCKTHFGYDSIEQASTIELFKSLAEFDRPLYDKIVKEDFFDVYIQNWEKIRQALDKPGWKDDELLQEIFFVTLFNSNSRTNVSELTKYLLLPARFLTARFGQYGADLWAKGNKADIEHKRLLHAGSKYHNQVHRILYTDDNAVGHRYMLGEQIAITKMIYSALFNQDVKDKGAEARRLVEKYNSALPAIAKETGYINPDDVSDVLYNHVMFMSTFERAIDAYNAKVTSAERIGKRENYATRAWNLWSKDEVLVDKEGKLSKPSYLQVAETDTYNPDDIRESIYMINKRYLYGTSKYLLFKPYENYYYAWQKTLPKYLQDAYRKSKRYVDEFVNEGVMSKDRQEIGSLAILRSILATHVYAVYLALNVRLALQNAVQRNLAFNVVGKDITASVYKLLDPMTGNLKDKKAMPNLASLLEYMQHVNMNIPMSEVTRLQQEAENVNINRGLLTYAKITDVTSGRALRNAPFTFFENVNWKYGFTAGILKAVTGSNVYKQAIKDGMSKKSAIEKALANPQVRNAAIAAARYANARINADPSEIAAPPGYRIKSFFNYFQLFMRFTHNYWLLMADVIAPKGLDNNMSALLTDAILYKAKDGTPNYAGHQHMLNVLISALDDKQVRETMLSKQSNLTEADFAQLRKMFVDVREMNKKEMTAFNESLNVSKGSTAFRRLAGLAPHFTSEVIISLLWRILRFALLGSLASIHGEEKKKRLMKRTADIGIVGTTADALQLNRLFSGVKLGVGLLPEFGQYGQISGRSTVKGGTEWLSRMTPVYNVVNQGFYYYTGDTMTNLFIDEIMPVH